MQIATHQRRDPVEVPEHVEGGGSTFRWLRRARASQLYTGDDFIIKPQSQHKAEATKQMEHLVEAEMRGTGVWPPTAVHEGSNDVQTRQKEYEQHLLRGQCIYVSLQKHCVE